MDHRWTSQSKDIDEKERFIKYMYSCRTLLERMSVILKDMDLQQETKETAGDVYDSPSWAFKQADTNGYRRCIRHIQQLITLDQRKDG